MSGGKPVSPVTRLAIDFGPLLVFFLANLLAPRAFGYAPEQAVFIATGCFMAATVAAMLVSRIAVGAISPMLLFSGVMVLGFGGLTLWLQDETFIKVKPTIYYLMLTSILTFGLVTRRPTLKLVLGLAYPGLNDRGWTLLSRNWAVFFLLLAIANEVVWRTMPTSFWIGFKLWGVFPATLIFAAANVPMLMRHGMGEDAAEKEIAQGPPVG